MAEEMYEEFEAIDLSSLDSMMDSFPGLGIEEPDPTEEDNNDGNEEPEETEEDVIDEIKEEPSSQDTNESSPLITPYAKMLVEEGLLPNIDIEKFDGTVDSLLEAQREYDRQRFESFKETTLDPRVKWLQDNLEQGVPLNKLLEFDEKKLTVGSITEEALSADEGLQKDILRNYYKETTMLSDERIDKVIERLETLGELESESKSSLQDLKSVLAQREQEAFKQAQLDRANSVKEQQRILQEFKDNLNSKEEIISGIKVSQLLKDKIYQTLTTPVAVDPNTGIPLNKIAQARAEDPLNFEINLAYIFEVTNGFKDWTTLGISGKRKAIKEFEESVQGMDMNKGLVKRPISSKDSRSYLDEMERISRQF